MARTVFDDLVDRLVDLVHDEAPRVTAPAVERGIVVVTEPLIVDIGDDLLLEEGDPDVEFDRALLADRPAKGDAVRVHSDGDAYIVAGVIEGGSDG